MVSETDVVVECWCASYHLRPHDHHKPDLKNGLALGQSSPTSSAQGGLAIRKGDHCQGKWRRIFTAVRRGCTSRCAVAHPAVMVNG